MAIKGMRYVALIPPPQTNAESISIFDLLIWFIFNDFYIIFGQITGKVTKTTECGIYGQILVCSR